MGKPSAEILNTITEKVKNKQPVTDQEEKFYMLYVLNLPESEVNKIIAEVDPKYKNTLID